jgi:hypothetical protein
MLIRADIRALHDRNVNNLVWRHLDDMTSVIDCMISTMHNICIHILFISLIEL